MRTAWSTSRRARAAARASRRRAPAGTPCALSRPRRPQREVAGRLPAGLVVVDVEVEAGRRRSGTRSRRARRRPGRAAASLEVVRDRHVRVVREGEVDVERAAAHGGGELLAARDALGERHEDDRRDRPEGAGAAQVHAEARRSPAATSPRCFSIAGQVVVVDLGRRHQRDVRGDRRARSCRRWRCGSPGAGSPRAPGWRARRRWCGTSATLLDPCRAAATKPTRS